MNIFFDLDGTLIDARVRLFQLFSNITNQTLLDFDDYWELKRATYSNEWILLNYFSYNENQISKFNSEWFAKIESDEYLSYDHIFPDTASTLKKISAVHNLYLITARQFANKVEQQLREMEIFYFFKKILVTGQKLSKAELIKLSDIQISDKDILIGDTGVDIQTAKEVGIRSVAVLSGFRNRAILKKYFPDYILKDIKEINQFI